MNREEPTEEVLQLFGLMDAQRDGTLTAEQRTSLHERLIADPNLRRVFVQEQMMAGAFHMETPGAMAEPEFDLVDSGTEFGMDSGVGGGSKVQVFDGEVKLYAKGSGRRPDQAHRLLGGVGLSWQASGAKAELAADPTSFPSFDDVSRRTEERARDQLSAWQEWNRSLADDPRIAVRYNFEGAGTLLRDSGSSQAHGPIIGAERTNGRWAEKGALEFKRPSDRVQMDIPAS